MDKSESSDDLNPFDFNTVLEIASLYRDFLDGNAMVPTYAAPLSGLNDDTKKQLQYIKRLNDLSFLTIDSQDGLEEVEENGNSSIQRSYVKGIMPNFLAKALYNDLAVSNIICMIIPMDETVENFCEDYFSKNEKEFISVIPLTVERIIQKDQLISQRIYTKHRGTIDCDAVLGLRYPHIKKTLYNNFSEVVVIDPVWKRSNYMVKIVIKRLEKIISTLKLDWNQSCNYFTSFDNDKLFKKFIELYPEFKDIIIPDKSKLFKQKICLLLSYSNMRRKVLLSGITPLNHYYETKFQDRKNEIQEWKEWKQWKEKQEKQEK